MRNLSSLMRVDGSRWLEWRREEASGNLDDRSLRHFAIYTAEDCIGVATECGPLITRRKFEK